MGELLQYITIFFAAMYGAAPLLVWYRWSHPGRYRLIPVSSEVFFSEVDREMKLSMERIVSIGFEYMQFARFRQMDTETKIALFENTQKPYLVYAAQISNPKVPSMIFTEVSYLFDDGTSLHVNNAPIASAFPKIPFKATFRLPQTTDVVKLVAAAEHLVKHYLPDKQPTSLPKEEVLKNIGSLMDKELEALVDRGYLKSVAEKALLKPTLKGAYSMTWKLLWPVKQICNSRDLAQTHSILSESGFFQ